MSFARRTRALVFSVCAAQIGCATADAEGDGFIVHHDGDVDATTDGSLGDEGDAAPIDEAGDEIGGSDGSVLPMFDVVDEPTADTSVLTCDETHYDVNGDPTDGCEVTDTETIHTEGTAMAFGEVSECDSTSSNVQHFAGNFPSDDRTHTPSGRNGTLGLPLWFTATHESETFCEDDPTFNVTVGAGSGTYRVTLRRQDGTIDSKCSPVEVGAGKSTGDVLCSSQNSGEVVSIEIEKVSGGNENPSIALTYHN
jgi:hypothetical protein